MVYSIKGQIRDERAAVKAYSELGKKLPEYQKVLSRIRNDEKRHYAVLKRLKVYK